MKNTDSFLLEMLCCWLIYHSKVEDNLELRQHKS